MSEHWIVGIHPVESALRHDAARVKEVLVEQGTRNPRIRGVSDLARQAGVGIHARPRDQLDRLAGKARHQGVVACYEVPPARHESDLSALAETAGAQALFLVLDGVTDPHNLGACLRSAAAAGATAVIVPKDRAVGMTPVVRRAAAGAAERVPLVEATNLARALRMLKDAGVWLVGLSGEGTQSLYATGLKGPLALVLGGEGEGMRRLTRETCDFVSHIPMPGAMESLNVSVAAGIALFETIRQRGE